ncbi:MAG: phosphoribosyl-AMP cyclohydrolase [Alphaproteobacteria bacterium]|nr:phosphoribosyl-AMP cyclohydrolase [Alphaproteobacteria bacterium]
MALSPKFNEAGLIPAIAQDAETGEVLMMAWMNAEALAQTLATRQAVYWSRSRRELWRKGASSGHTQEVLDIRVDCDQDTLLLSVRQTGAACHTGRKSCFYRSVTDAESLDNRSAPPEAS